MKMYVSSRPGQAVFLLKTIADLPRGPLVFKVDMMLVHRLTKWTPNKYFYQLKKHTLNKYFWVFFGTLNK